jgi:hypothetical protein
MLVPDDSTQIEVVPNDSGGRYEIRVARDRGREPVDIGRFECGDLAEGVTVELPEFELALERVGERRAGGRSEVPDPGPREGPRRGARTWWLTLLDRDPEGLVTAQRGTASPRRSGSDRLVPWSDRPRGVNASGDRSTRLRPGRTTATPGRCAALPGTRSPSRAILGPAATSATRSGQRRVGVVDLRHLTGGDS